MKTITLNPGLSIPELNKAIALNPSNAEAYVFLAYTLIEMGRFKEAEMNLAKAEQLAPATMLMQFAWVRFYTFSRNPEKLFAIMKEIGFANQRSAGDYRKNLYYFLKDQYDSMLIYSGGRFATPVLRGIAFAKTGKSAQAVKIIDSLKTKSENDHAFDIGIIYAWLGEKAKAIEYLQLAYRLYDYNLISIKVDKLFDPLRNEEGFKELLRRMGME